MARNLLSRYIWLIDTINRYGRITRDRLNALWLKSPHSDGNPLPRRTLYNYRNAIEELFNISIVSDPKTFEYYIASDNRGENDKSLTDWLLNSATVSNVIGGLRDVSDKVFLENVPSARAYLGIVIDALRENRLLRFSYHPYTRLNPTPGVVIEPYFLKIFRQRWYITGRNIRDNSIKTYALDRMSDVIEEETTFVTPPDFDPARFVSDSFGIVFTRGTTHRVALRTDSRQAKYLRALPLHHSQSEVIHDNYSIFYYNLRLTPDFLQEILSLGPNVKVIAPPELRAMVTQSLRDTLALYDE
ncbi:MAG: WYL domain-containing protein [Lachnoclostridium sp.]|nr:WYL domain-containing protein [Lachnoclostridium sp.]